MDFARDHLKKHGWVDGSGLGKDESGMKEAIKVKVKQDKTGVGHDPGAEFTFHWWDHVFNKAANKFQVEQTQDGVEVKANGAETERSRTNDKKRKKAMLYGKFVKGATLKGANEEEEEPCEMEEEPEGGNAPVTVTSLITADDEEILRKCGGRTAHKGARHGLKLNGKLYRIEQQEKLRLERETSQSSGKSSSQSGKSSSQSSSKSSSQSDATIPGSSAMADGENVTDVGDGVDEASRKKKKKKRKKREENCGDTFTEVENVHVSTDSEVRIVDSVDTSDRSDAVVTDENNCDNVKKEKKSKKKKKRTEKQEKGDTVEFGIGHDGDNVEVDKGDESVKVRKRKSLDEEVCDDSVVKKKSKKKKKCKA